MCLSISDWKSLDQSFWFDTSGLNWWLHLFCEHFKCRIFLWFIPFCQLHQLTWLVWRLACWAASISDSHHLAAFTTQMPVQGIQFWVARVKANFDYYSNLNPCNGPSTTSASQGSKLTCSCWDQNRLSLTFMVTSLCRFKKLPSNLSVAPPHAEVCLKL